ncbi:MAG: 1-acyl-sn-glycerol-3-phosphate acyltransferase [Bacteroidetes bacterium]|nr:1-acyl-sn-glycerol-3-phosphate acyltransferase [Bacteroidota bacterium]
MSRFLLSFTFIRIRVHGKEKLDREQAYIFVTNHISLMDVPAAALATPHTFKYLVKSELRKIPLMGFVIDHMYISVSRGSGIDRQRSMDLMQEELNNGMSIFIYPEGTRNKGDNKLQPFYDGAFRLALRSSKPIAVMTILNSAKVLPPSKFWLSPGTIDVYWDEPIDVSGMSLEDTGELKEKARAEIDQRGDELIRVAKTILENPEPGFREEKTSRLVA